MKKNIYIINYPEYEKDLCKMEQRVLFGKDTDEKYLFSNKDINVSRSPFLKEKIEIMYSSNSFQDIIKYVCDKKLSFNSYKVIYVKLSNNDLPYKERINCVKEIGYRIIGTCDMNNPKNIIALLKFKDTWIIGNYIKNDLKWHIHEDKPKNYSNSIGVRLARAIINIAAGNDLDKTLIDPCCGVGTVVLEGLSMNINITGCEINKQIAANARRNLEFFGYDKDNIKCFNMHNIKQKYDTAIIDLPYGLFTPISKEEQVNIIKTARKITNKLVIILFEDMDDILINCGFNIIDKCIVSKGLFKRQVLICN